jgi:hypothetical protein
MGRDAGSATINAVTREIAVRVQAAKTGVTLLLKAAVKQDREWKSSD